MSSTQPASTTELKEYALRKLGKPVVEVNLADEQMNDLIDEAIQYFQEYHFDGTERHFLVELVEASTLTFSSASTGTFEEGETITGGTSNATAKIHEVTSTTLLKFKEHKDGCEIDFIVEFEFNSIIFQTAIERLFSNAVKKMVFAFEKRADTLYKNQK